MDQLRKGANSRQNDRCTSFLEEAQELCESPIEITLAVALLIDDLFEVGKVRGDLFLVGQAELSEANGYSGCRLLIPQYEWNGKRIDFKLVDPPAVIFIECDGHEFHERTKQQAARDRSRDRAIQCEGIPILRFTGSEIYKDVFECVREINRFVWRHQARLVA